MKIPFNGSGSYSLPYNWQSDAANGLNISSSRMQAQDADIAAALSLCLTKDGQQPVAANLQMGGFTLTNVANAIAQKQPITVQDFQNGTPTWLGTVSGTDTIIGAANISPAVYAKGQKFRGITAGANTTSAVTLNVNGLGAVPVVKNGSSALAPGDFAAGQVFEVSYDGTNFQITGANNGHGTLINVQLITASGTYTPTPGATNGFAWAVGGGDAGGGTQAVASGFVAAGSGGTGGAFGILRLPTLTTLPVTIGAGGVGVVGAPGGVGSATSIGSLMTCPGGGSGGAVGAQGGGNGGSPFICAAAGSPSAAVTGSGNIVFSRRGSAGLYGLALLNAAGGNGGDSFWGAGGVNGAGTNYGGAGAGSSILLGAQAATAGFNGAQGAALFFEYA